MRAKKGDPKPKIRTLPPQEELLRLFSYDPATGELRWRLHRGPRAAGSLAGTVGNHGYLIVGINGVYSLAHRIIWKMVLGDDPSEFVDHRDGDKLNNRWDNFRAASNGQNIQNSKLRRDNRSGVKGVLWDAWHKKWVAVISAGQGQIKLGRFASKDDAITARFHAEKRLHGEFARAEA